MHVLGSFGMGGAEMGVVRMIREFPDAGVRHSVLSLSRDLSLKSWLPARVSCESLPRNQVDRTVFLRLAALFSEKKVDIAHVNNLGPWFDTALAARMAGIKSLETFHGVENPELHLSWAKKIQARLSLGLGHGVTAVSPPAAALFSRLTGIDECRLTLIPNSVDTRRFAPVDERTRQALKKKLHLPVGEFLVGCVAALRPVKDHAGLIEAFARIKEINASVCLVLVGTGPLRKPLQQQAEQLGVADRVVFTGVTHAVEDYLKCLDLFVLNSITEGLSYAVLEAMSTGVPVVATRVGGNPLVVKEGVTGCLVPRKNSHRLAETVLHLAGSRELRLNMGRQARTLVQDRFSLDHMLQQYLRLYTQTLSR